MAERAARLDEIEESHAAVGGTERGRRFTTLQINQSYCVMLCSHFQGFCRDLHDECCHSFSGIFDPHFRSTIRDLLLLKRTLDRGNPNAGNVGSDFNRFGIQFWPEVRGRDQRATTWQNRLNALTSWRNAIAHQDFSPGGIDGVTTVPLNLVRQWRKACNGLARVFDRTMRTHLQSLSGTAPW